MLLHAACWAAHDNVESSQRGTTYAKQADCGGNTRCLELFDGVLNVHVRDSSRVQRGAVTSGGIHHMGDREGYCLAPIQLHASAPSPRWLSSGVCATVVCAGWPTGPLTLPSNLPPFNTSHTCQVALLSGGSAAWRSHDDTNCTNSRSTVPQRRSFQCNICNLPLRHA
jgi:hypothetical protein